MPGNCSSRSTRRRYTADSAGAPRAMMITSSCSRLDFSQRLLRQDDAVGYIGRLGHGLLDLIAFAGGALAGEIPGDGELVQAVLRPITTLLQFENDSFPLNVSALTLIG
jgi:hypothetical protein